MKDDLKDYYGNQKFYDFCKKYGDAAAEELLETIADATWNHDYSEVKITDTHTINACNHVFSGHITYDKADIYFIIESGDINGTLIHEFGSIDDVGVYEPPKPTQYMFVPKNETPLSMAIHEEWKKSDWFQEKLRNYHYDKHFQPGCKIEKYYADWAASKGMKIEVIEND